MLVVPQPMDAYRPSHDQFWAFVVAYHDLLRARRDAENQQLQPYQSPVLLSRLRASGIDDNFLLWMMYHGHVEHLRPKDSRRPRRGALTVVGSLVMLEADCVRLTDLGKTFAENFRAGALGGDHDAFEAAWDSLVLGRLVPHYDHEERIFSWGRHVLKHYLEPAPNQDWLLRGAQELGWPPWFDDPLPPKPGIRPKGRLKDTIKRLNGHQHPYLIHFKGDGTGRRVGWEYH